METVKTNADGTYALGAITHTVRELPADFYGSRFYVHSTREVTNLRTGNKSITGQVAGCYFRTRAEAQLHCDRYNAAESK